MRNKMPRSLLISLFVLVGGCGWTEEPAPEPSPDAAPVPLCSELAGCENALCTTAGVCVCNRPGEPPADCTRAPS